MSEHGSVPRSLGSRNATVEDEESAAQASSETSVVETEQDDEDPNAIPLDRLGESPTRLSDTAPEQDTITAATRIQDLDTEVDDVYPQPGNLPRIDTEAGLPSWIIPATDDDEETDKFGRYLSQHDKELYQIYQSHRLDDAHAIRSAFSMFICKLVDTPESQNTFRRVIYPILPERMSSRPPTSWERYRTRIVGNQRLLPWTHTVSSAIDVFDTWLRAPMAAGLQVVLIAREIDTPESEFSYWRMLWSQQSALTVEFRSGLPFRFVLQLFNSTDYWAASIINDGLKSAASFDPRFLVELPSRSPRAITEASDSFFFSWPRSIPKPSISSMYIWQTYKKPLNFARVNLFVQDRGDGLFKAVLVFDRNSSLIKASLWLEQELRQSDSQRQYQITRENIGKAQLDEMVYALERYTISCIANFVSVTFWTLRNSDLAARDDPSRTRQLYIFELEDYSKLTRHYVKEYLRVLKTSLFQDSEAVTPEMKQKLIDDYEYLLNKLKKIKRETSRASERLAKMSEFRQTQHGAWTNALLALFIPAAFVASYYGMNVAEITGDTIPVSSFWKVAVPLTIAVVLIPLVFTATIRFGARSSVRLGKALKHNWPGLALGFPVFTIAVFFIWHMATPEINVDPPDLDSFKDFVLNVLTFVYATLQWIGSTFHERTKWDTPVVHSLLAFVAIFMVLTSISTRKRSMAEIIWWSSLAIVAILCASLNHLDNTGWVTFALPFIYIAFPLVVAFVVGLIVVCIEFIQKKRTQTEDTAPETGEDTQSVVRETDQSNTSIQQP